MRERGGREPSERGFCFVTIRDGQVKKLMMEFTKSSNIGRSALRAGMDRKTASKYLKIGKLPSELCTARDWRTREDPFHEHWPWVEERLRQAPKLNAKTLFDELCRLHPERYQEGQLRTLQRHVRTWRAERGPEKEIFFPQEHLPGKVAQLDFTRALELKVTIKGELFAHLLCNFVLIYSNWQWVTVCLSESFLALKQGIQAALQRLGHAPSLFQIDNSTSATHEVKKGRGFNERFVGLMNHYDLNYRTTGVGKKEQNGDVEASNGVLKRQIEQDLLLRGSREFESVEAYENWINEVVGRKNKGRAERLNQELQVMEKVTARRLPSFDEERLRVGQQSSLNVRRNVYSVPSRLIGHEVRVRIFERVIEVWHGEKLQMQTPRLLGRQESRIDYRHMIWSMVRKPGAFARYRYRMDMFPSLVFRRAYDRLSANGESTKVDLEYLRILFLAARTMQCDVESALQLLLETPGELDAQMVKELVEPSESPPEQEPLDANLEGYDKLLPSSAALLRAGGTK